MVEERVRFELTPTSRLTMIGASQGPVLHHKRNFHSCERENEFYRVSADDCPSESTDVLLPFSPKFSIFS